MKLAEIAGIPKEDTLEIVEKMRNNAASHNRLYQANMEFSSGRTCLENCPELEDFYSLALLSSFY